MIMYMDGIILSSDDIQEIQETKQHLQKTLVTKDLGPLHYFLAIEVAKIKKGVVLSQKKYVLDLLRETGILEAKPTSIPIDSKIHLNEKSTDLIDARQYR